MSYWVEALFQVNGSGCIRLADIIRNGSEWEAYLNGKLYKPAFHVYGDGYAPCDDYSSYGYVSWNKDMQVGESASSGNGEYIHYWTCIMGYREVVDPEPSFVSWGNAESQTPQEPPNPATWLAGYRYRKGVLINGVYGAGYGYQIMFRIRRNSGTDSGHIVYLNGKCLETFGDIRFADSEGNLLPYAIVSQSTDEAIVWVKLSTLNLDSDQIVYLYYGNLTAEAGISASDIDSTFIFYEDWSDETLSKWTGGTPTKIEPALHRIQFKGPITRQLDTVNTLSFPSYFIVESCDALQGELTPVQTKFYAYSISQDKGIFSCHAGDFVPSNKHWGTVFCGFYGSTSTPQGQAKEIAGVDSVILNQTDFTQGARTREWLIIRQGNVYTIYMDGQVFVNTTSSSTPNSISLYFYGDSNAYPYVYFYGFKIRKYIDPEPEPTTWYAEEEQGEGGEGSSIFLNVDVYPSELESLAVPFKLNGTAYAAPQTLSVSQGVYVLEVVQQIVAVNTTHQANFTAWYVNDTQYSIEPSITINISGNTTATMHYAIAEVSGGESSEESSSEEQSPPSSEEEEDEPSSFPPSYPFGGYAPVHFEAFNVELGIVKAGSTVNFEIGFSFDQVQIRVERVEFQQQSEWFTLDTLLPKTFSRGTDIIGTGKIQAVFHAPKDVDGTFMIPYTIYAVTSDGRQVSAQASISVTISKSQGVGIGDGTNITQPVLGNPLVLGLLALSICWFGYYAIKGKK